MPTAPFNPDRDTVLLPGDEPSSEAGEADGPMRMFANLLWQANFEEMADGKIKARLSRTNHMAVIEAFWNQKPSELYLRVRCPVLLMPTRGRGSRPKEWREWAERSSARGHAPPGTGWCY